MSMDEFDFDIAVSFAGEDRGYVEPLVEKMASRLAVFYDYHYKAELWGECLLDRLEAVYRLRARYALVVVSRHYGTGMWTRFEFQCIQARALTQTSSYILPLRLDDTELPGLHSTTGYLDARKTDVDEIVAVLVRKVDPSSGFTLSSRRNKHRGNVVLIDRFLDARAQAARFGRPGESRGPDWIVRHSAG